MSCGAQVYVPPAQAPGPDASTRGLDAGSSGPDGGGTIASADGGPGPGVDGGSADAGNVGATNVLVGLAGKCLTAMPSGAAVISTCGTSPAQQWALVQGRLENADGRCLDVSGEASLNGAATALSACGGAPGQSWALQGKAVVGLGGRCLDVIGGGNTTADGTATELWDCTGFANQQWTWGLPAPDAGSGGDAGTGVLPAKVLTTYYWPFGSHPTLTEVQANAPLYNCMSYVAAMPSGNGNGDMTLNGGAEPNLAGMIASWKASGRCALIMVSANGAGGVGINLFSDTDAAAFVASMSTLIDTYGFQGVDWDLEDSFSVTSCTGVVAATNRLKAKYGTGFAISAVPRDYEVRNNGPWGQCMKQMGDNLDLIALQEYDNVAYADPAFGQIQADYADLIGQGFPAGKVLLGTATFSGTSVSGGAASPQTYGNAFTFLEGHYGLRGAVVWQSGSDFSDAPSWSYQTALAAAIGL